ncbi:hypothetical protein FF2_010019 [Malus domestica]
MGGRAIVRNSKQRAKSTGGIVDHDEHLGNAVEKTDGFRFWGRTIACDGEIRFFKAETRPKVSGRGPQKRGGNVWAQNNSWAEGVSSVGINSTAARTVDCLSKSRSRRVFESLLVEVISLAFSARLENPRGRDAFLSRPQSQDAEVSSATQRSIIKFTPRPSLGRRVGTPRNHRRT